jgi:UDP-N-acetylglucosamine acyltransferase
MSGPRVHATAGVAPGADLSDDVVVGPYAVIGAQVRLGPRTSVGAHAVIEGRTTIGADNRIFQFAAVGAVPQDLKYHGEASELHIGDRNMIREFATLHPGTEGGGMLTRVGDDCLIMNYAHVAHDCLVGNHVIVANGAQLGGHVTVQDFVVVGALAGIHQFVKIGESAILGAGAMVSLDVAPFCNATGDRATLHGLNLLGLRRRQLSAAGIATIRSAYRIIFQSGLKARAAVDRVRAELADSPEALRMAAFVEEATRGLCRPARRSSHDDDEG